MSLPAVVTAPAERRPIVPRRPLPRPGHAERAAAAGTGPRTREGTEQLPRPRAGPAGPAGPGRRRTPADRQLSSSGTSPGREAGSRCASTRHGGCGAEPPPSCSSTAAASMYGDLESTTPCAATSRSKPGIRCHRRRVPTRARTRLPSGRRGRRWRHTTRSASWRLTSRSTRPASGRRGRLCRWQPRGDGGPRTDAARPVLPPAALYPGTDACMPDGVRAIVRGRLLPVPRG